MKIKNAMIKNVTTKHQDDIIIEMDLMQEYKSFHYQITGYTINRLIKLILYTGAETIEELNEKIIRVVYDNYDNIIAIGHPIEDRFLVVKKYGEDKEVKEKYIKE